MPAPTVPPAPLIQVFGLVDSRPTQAALRFFRERRVDLHFVDLRKNLIAPGELRRFVDRLGARACAACRSLTMATPAPPDPRPRPGRRG